MKTLSLANRVSSFGESIFAEMTALANKHQAVNLGQGFPNFPCPDFVKKSAYAAIENNQNQYARSAGLPALVEKLASYYNPILKKEIHPQKEIVVTVGATEAIFASCQAFLNPGDHAICIQPFYDSYPCAVSMAGGIPVYVSLRLDKSGTWLLDEKELRAAFNSKPKIIFINTPNNPTGKVFSLDELQLIAQLCQEHNVIAICDEVYEHIIFNAQHISMAQLPQMWERTVTISSAGKTFSTTGWKVGWVVGDANLVGGIQQARQWISFAVATPFQEAFSKSLAIAQENGYFQQLQKMYREKRDFLFSVLADAGLNPIVSQGTYFLMADVSSLQQKLKLANDVVFCKYLTTEIGVAAIPPSAFYANEHKHMAQNLVRFAFCKDENTLQEASRRLRRLK